MQPRKRGESQIDDVFASPLCDKLLALPSWIIQSNVRIREHVAGFPQLQDLGGLFSKRRLVKEPASANCRDSTCLAGLVQCSWCKPQYSHQTISSDRVSAPNPVSS